MRQAKWTAVLLASASLLVVGVLLGTSACNLNNYCLDCAATDGGPADANTPSGDAGDADLSDAGDGGDACTSSGIEQCDGMDNDCDGNIDEGTLPGVGATCGTSVGECETGTTICDSGAIVCDGATTPTFELCNTFDDDCDGNVDENNPQGGIICGTSQGECEAGVQTCNAGTLECLNQVVGSAETCNGLDDDCDGSFDEGITTAGNCGPVSDQGLCTFGTNTCIGGSMQCVGAVLPVLEICDNIDQDCDGDPLNGFNLASDAQNCGSCGNVCSAPNAFMFCNNSNCEIAACATGFHDLTAAPGCEYGPCTFQGAEICDGIDNDCDNVIDEGVDAFAPLCDQDGECSGATATCDSGLGQYVCNFGPTVSVNASGAIIPEVDCDELDNDCDGQVDEAFVNKGTVCDDGEVGQCRDTGTIVCNATDNGVICNAVDDPSDNNPPAESCNNQDDDCDGNVDESDPRDWVTIAGGVEIMKYEASRPDSTALVQGFVTDQAVCSDPGRLPWTNVTQPEAEAACARIGATLCDESVWQTACETDNLNPLTQSGTQGLMTVEAEDMTHVAGSNANWIAATGLNGFSGTSIRYLSPDGSSHNSGSLGTAARLDQALLMTTAGNKYIWVRMWADNSSDDDIWVGFDGNTGSADNLDPPVDDSWEWVRSGAFNLSAVSHTVNIYGGDGGVIVDRVIVTSDVNFVPLNQGPPDQCQWSYESDCRNYQPDTCNGEDFDGDSGTAGDQDIVLATGSMNACYSEWEAGGDVFDMSGNVKEWTAERPGPPAGVNPIRGGSYNNTAIGTSCQFDFLTADDNFFLPNIGFRCCR